MTTFDYDLSDSSLIAQAMRRVRDHFPAAFSKLLSMQWHTTDRTPYGATDGKRLLLNPAGLAKLEKTSDPVGFTGFLLAHEAAHALLNHGYRLSRLPDHQTANEAADYLINAMLVEINQKAFRKHQIIPFPLIPRVLIDPDLSGDTSAEELYQILWAAKMAKPKPRPKLTSGDGGEEGEEEGEDEGGTPPPAGDKPGDEDEEGEEGEGGEGEEDEDEEGEEGEGGEGEEDEDEDEEGEEGEGGEGEEDEEGEEGEGGEGEEDEKGNSEGDQPLSDEDILGDDWVGSGAPDLEEPEFDPSKGESLDEVARKIDEANERIFVEDAINSAAGMVSGASLRGVSCDRLPPAGVPWEEQIREWMAERAGNRWIRPFNPHLYSSTGLIGAGRESKSHAEFGIVIDSSCSVSSRMFTRMLGAVQELKDNVRPACIWLASCDTRIYLPVTELRGDDFVPTRLPGGGGTLFGPAFRWFNENRPDIEGLVYFTDGGAYDLCPKLEPHYPVLWVHYGSLPLTHYPFGTAIRADLYSR